MARPCFNKVAFNYAAPGARALPSSPGSSDDMPLANLLPEKTLADSSSDEAPVASLLERHRAPLPPLRPVAFVASAVVPAPASPVSSDDVAIASLVGPAQATSDDELLASLMPPGANFDEP